MNLEHVKAEHIEIHIGINTHVEIQYRYTRLIITNDSFDFGERLNAKIVWSKLLMLSLNAMRLR